MDVSSKSALEQCVRDEQIRALFSKGRVALLVNLCNASIVVLALGSSLLGTVFLPWLVAMVSISGARLWILRRQHHGSDQARAGWAHLWILGAGLNGVLWGIAGAFFTPMRDFGEALVLVVIAGMVAGASGTLSSYLPAFLAFALPALVPVVVRQAVQGGRLHWVMSLLALIFCLATSAVTAESQRLFKQSVRLRYKNQFLAEDLAGTQEKLAVSNRELEARVGERTRELQQALSDRDSFVSVLSHELRTPITALKLNLAAFQKMLDAHPIDLSRLRRLFSALPRLLSRVQRLVDDLLDVRRLSTDQMRYVWEPTEVKQVLDDSVEQLAPQLVSADVEFTVEAEENLTGNWDRSRIEQVLLNLMTNALRHGRPPFSIVARRVDRHAEIVVRDQGEGIPPEKLPRVFEPFQRANAHEPSGLGLGLYIAERIVLAHQGTIRAENAVGKGVAFIVELPLSPAHPPGGAPPLR